MQKILIVNNAEPGIAEFVRPIEKIVEDAGATSFCIEYRDRIAFSFSRLIYNFTGLCKKQQ
jgi:hypothetical protein